MGRTGDTGHTNKQYDVKHAPFDEHANSAEAFNSVLLSPVFDKAEAISFAKETWAEKRGEVHVYEETWDDDYLVERKIVFVKTNDGKEYGEAEIKETMAGDSSIRDVIRKTPDGYVVYSEKGKKLSKAYKTRGEAEERLRQIEAFKHMETKDSQYKGYSIEWRDGYFRVWKHTYDGKNWEVGNGFPNEGEAREFIDSLAESEPAPVAKKHRYRVDFVEDNDESTCAYIDAESPEEAVKIANAHYGRHMLRIVGVVKINDSKGGTEMKKKLKKDSLEPEFIASNRESVEGFIGQPLTAAQQADLKRGDFTIVRGWYIELDKKGQYWVYDLDRVDEQTYSSLMGDAKPKKADATNVLREIVNILSNSINEAGIARVYRTDVGPDRANVQSMYVDEETAEEYGGDFQDFADNVTIVYKDGKFFATPGVDGPIDWFDTATELVKSFNAEPTPELEKLQAKLREAEHWLGERGGNVPFWPDSAGKAKLEHVPDEALMFEGEDSVDTAYFSSRYNVDMAHTDSFGYDIVGSEGDIKKLYDDFSLSDYGIELAGTEVHDAEGDGELTEEEYSQLASEAGCDDLFDFYDMSDKAANVFDVTYEYLGYPRHDEWVIHPDVLRDKSKVDKLRSEIRKAIVSVANDGRITDLLNPHDKRYAAEETVSKLLKSFKIRVIYDSKPEIDVEIEGELDKRVDEAYQEYCRCVEKSRDGEFKYSDRLVELLNRLSEATSTTTRELMGMFREMCESEGIKSKPRDSVPAKDLEISLTKAFLKYMDDFGYDEQTAKDHVRVTVKTKKDYDDDAEYVEVKIYNDLVEYHEALEECPALIESLNNLVTPGYFEPDYPTVWTAYIHGYGGAAAKDEGASDSESSMSLVEKANKALIEHGWDELDFTFEHETDGQGGETVTLRAPMSEQRGKELNDCEHLLNELVLIEWPGAHSIYKYDDEWVTVKWERP